MLSSMAWWVARSQSWARGTRAPLGHAWPLQWERWAGSSVPEKTAKEANSNSKEQGTLMCGSGCHPALLGGRATLSTIPSATLTRRPVQMFSLITITTTAFIEDAS